MFYESPSWLLLGRSEWRQIRRIWHEQSLPLSLGALWLAVVSGCLYLPICRPLREHAVLFDDK
jgi:hypothetical protein